MQPPEVSSRAEKPLVISSQAFVSCPAHLGRLGRERPHRWRTNCATRDASRGSSGCSLGLGIGQFATIQAAAPSFGLEVDPIDVRDPSEIERTLAIFARGSDLGLLVTTSALAVTHRDLIVALATRYRLPAVYPLRLFAVTGGLMSYGPDIVDQYRQAAGYVNRILNGEKTS